MKKLMLWVAFLGIATTAVFAQTSAPSPNKPGQISKSETPTSAPTPPVAPVKQSAELAKPEIAPVAPIQPIPAPAPIAVKPAKPESNDKAAKPKTLKQQPVPQPVQAPVVK